MSHHRVIITAKAKANGTRMAQLLEEIDAQHLLADRTDDTDEILVYCFEHNINVVISSKRNDKIQQYHDEYIYRQASPSVNRHKYDVVLFVIFPGI